MIKLSEEYKKYLVENHLQQNTISAYMTDVKQYLQFLSDKGVKRIDKVDAEYINEYVNSAKSPLTKGFVCDII